MLEQLMIDWTISVGDLVRAVFGVIGLTGLFLAYWQLRLSWKANRESAAATRARFVLDLNKWFLENDDEIRFFYRLDYSSHPNAFRFDGTEFPNSPDELRLDALLFKVSHVGALLRHSIVTTDDLDWIHFHVRTVMENPEVQAYLVWIKLDEQVPDHSAFTDAIYLYKVLYGRSESYEKLKPYLN